MPTSALFDLDRFGSLLATITVGREIDYHLQVGSTMDIARQHAIDGAPGGMLVLAEEQTAGRGRRGRSFTSPPGENLYFTLVLRLDLDALRKVPVAVPMAVCTGCRALGAREAAVKWPNDIWVGDRKLSGMLIDSELGAEGALAFPGIGINVNGDPTLLPGLADIATSLRLVTGTHIDREALLAHICNDLESNLAVPYGDLVGAYRELSMILGRKVAVAESDDTVYEAEAVDLGPDGSLVVELPGGERRTVTAGDVSVRPA